MTAMTATRTAELMSRLPAWFVDHANRTAEKARRRREKLAKRYELLEAARGGHGLWQHTAVEFAVTRAMPRLVDGPSQEKPQPAAAPSWLSRLAPKPESRAAARPSAAWAEFMTPEELRDLTGRRALSGQIDALTADRIPHKLLRNRLLVSRFHVREWLAGRLPELGGGVQFVLAS